MLTSLTPRSLFVEQQVVNSFGRNTLFGTLEVYSHYVIVPWACRVLTIGPARLSKLI